MRVTGLKIITASVKITASSAAVQTRFKFQILDTSLSAGKTFTINGLVLSKIMLTGSNYRIIRDFSMENPLFHKLTTFCSMSLNVSFLLFSDIKIVSS